MTRYAALMIPNPDFSDASKAHKTTIRHTKVILCTIAGEVVT
jgi:hypothetical protein